MTLAEPYGSDKAGLVAAYLFGSEETARELDSDAAARWIAERRRAGPAGGFAWLHFSVSNAAAEPWMREHLDLPDAFYDSLREARNSTRVERAEDTLLAVVNDVLYDFTFDPSAVSTVSLCVTESLVVSARVKALRSIDRLRASVRSGEAFRSSAELLAHLLRDQADVMVGLIRESTARVDGIEDTLLDSRIAASRAELGALRRVLVRLQRLLAPEPAALFRLLSRPPVWVSEEDLRELQQSAEEFSTALADSQALVERIKLLQEELAASINEQNNRSLFVLTIVTVLALPINLVAGFFGMNVGGIPLAENPSGFWIVVAIVAIFTVVAGVLAFRRRDQ